MIWFINQNLRKLIIFGNINYLLHEGYLSLEYVDNEESNFAIELNSFDKGIKTVEKKFFF